MKKTLTIFILLFSIINGRAQTFLNEDLDGLMGGASVIPYNWLGVPFGDPNCLASAVAGATADITYLTGPNVASGLLGNPYSGNTFVSGLHMTSGNTYWQEGIMQVVSGLSSGCLYTANFYQAVKKQNNARDTSGGWSLYLDTFYQGTSVSSISNLPPNSTSMNWDFRSIPFTAFASSMNFKFLPMDDDTTHGSSTSNTNGALRMGIDSVYLLFVGGPVVDLGNDTTLCPGSTLNLSLNLLGVTYLWPDNSTGNSFTVSQPGTYWVQVTTGCGVFTDTIQVNYYNIPTLTLGNDTTLCDNQTLLLNPQISNATYLWQDNSSNPTFTVTQPGTYWVHITLPCGVLMDTIQVNYNYSPAIQLGADTVLCTGDTLILSSGLNNVWPHVWQDNSTDTSFVVTGPGIYWVNVTNSCGSPTDSILVTYVQQPSIDLGNDTTICEGVAFQLNAFTNGATYLWQDASVLPTYQVINTGNYWAQVSIGSCVDTDTVVVTVNPAPVVNLGSDTIICQGSTIQLSAAYPSATYLWKDGTTQSTLNVNTAGYYWVTVTGANTCKAYDTIQVTIQNIPLVDLGPDTTLCADQQIVYDVTTPGASYLWQDFTTGAQYTVNSSGNYWVGVTINKCTGSDTVAVQVKPIPSVYLGPDTTLCPTEKIVLNATTPGAGYLWQDLSIWPTYEVDHAGLYQVKVTVDGCTGTDAIQVNYNAYCECSLYLPNAFSPNGDGLNDEFRPVDITGAEVFAFGIYNRWGEQVFFSEYFEHGWNGNQKLKEAESGVYYYYLKYRCLGTGEEHTVKGDVLLIR
ncbi:MAG: gliding motility-associated C-terminal domain-containing protein [Chitinophagaceae bacterium]|nr:gliding motility-associated C-terminal domain-containing protein [Chitinophagaceae bacterium]